MLSSDLVVLAELTLEALPIPLGHGTENRKHTKRLKRLCAQVSVHTLWIGRPRQMPPCASLPLVHKPLHKKEAIFRINYGLCNVMRYITELFSN